MGKFYTSVLSWGNRVLVRGIDSHGVKIKHSYRYEPRLYIPAPNGSVSYRTLSGKSVKPIDFKCIKAARNWMEGQDGSNADYYGLELFHYVWLSEQYPDSIEFDPGKIVVANIDIEVAADQGFPSVALADKPIPSITIKHCDKYVVAFGCGEYVPPDDRSVYYVKCKDEKHLLERFLDYWEHIEPDVITGWNVGRFDIPYLINRITRLFDDTTAKRLSPWGWIHEGHNTYNGQRSTNPQPLGIAVLDYQELYTTPKFQLDRRESYRLDYIAYVELGERKLDYSEYSSLTDLYQKNYQKFMEYNIRDVLLVDRLEKKLGLINLTFLIAYRAKVNYVDALGSVRLWDVILHNYLMERGIVVPAKRDANRENLVGAFVKETQLGLHEWLVSLDLDSLYPHLIMQLNISPETYRGKLNVDLNLDRVLAGDLGPLQEQIRQANVTCAANLATYDRSKKGFLPEVLETMYQERVGYKKAMIEAEKEYQRTKDPRAKERAIRAKNIQKAIKVNLNAAYGVMTNAFFRYYSHPNAEAVTTSGQLAIRWIEDRLNAYMNKLLSTEGVDYIIAMDTDSVYLKLGPLIRSLGKDWTKQQTTDYIDRAVGEGFVPLLEKWYAELAVYMNAVAQRMSMKRESIADKGVWTGKKRYVLNIWDKEGVRFAEPEIEIKGMESVRSTTPDCCRKKFQEAIKILMTKDESTMIRFIDEFRKQWQTLPFEDIATPSSVNGLSKYSDRQDIYQKGTPMHVKGALIHNKLIKQMGISGIQPIFEADKIKFTALLGPNPINATVIAARDYLPEQFGLESYIDRDAQFDKGFLQPIKRILDVVGWRTEKLNTLENLFVW